MSKSLRRSDYLLPALLAVAVFVLIKSAPTLLYVSGDSQENLVTAQSLLVNKTIRLDAYYPQDRPGTVNEEGGHLYYGFPLGTPLLSVPFVGVELLGGKDMLVEADNFALQRNLAALTVSLSMVLVYLICRCFVGYWLSFMFSVVFVFGSSIISTMGTALWSIDFAFLFMLITILLLIYDSRGKLQSAVPYLSGGSLFLAYLSRPTTSAMVLAVFAYVLLFRRPLFLRMAATLALLAGGFVLFSWLEFGQMLPSYYLPSRLSDTETFRIAVYGNLASPGRGVLVYSPFLIVVMIGLALVFRRIWRQPLLWLALVWIGLHLVIVSRLGYWWGGWGFGSRFMTETLPAWLLIALIVWRAAPETTSKPVYRGLTAAFVALGAIAVYFNTVQGLYNPVTVDWNRWFRPTAKNEYPESVYMLDWKYPQFLASPPQLEARRAEYTIAESLQPITEDESIVPESETVAFEGWYAPEKDGSSVWRWSNGNTSEILFRIEPSLVKSQKSLAVQVTASYHQPQQITVLLNGKGIGVITNLGGWTPSQSTLPIDSSLLVSSMGRNYNTLEFQIPDAISPAAVEPGNPDNRILGMALREVKLIAVD